MTSPPASGTRFGALLERIGNLVTAARRGDYARMLSGTALGQGAVFLTTPLVTRLYSPRDVGIFMVLAAFVGIASYTTSWRLELALVSERDETRARSLFALCLALCLPMALLIGVCAQLTARANAQSASQGTLALALVSTLALVTGVFTALRYWHVRQAQFSIIARGLTVQGMARAVAPLLAAVWRSDWITLAFAEIAGRLAGIRGLGKGIGPALRGSFRPAMWRDLLRVNWKFPALLMPSGVLDSLAQSAAIPVVALHFGAAPAGKYALAIRIGGTAVTLLSASAGDILHTRIAKLGTSERVAFVRRQAVRLGLLGVAIFVPLALIAPFVAGPLLGKGWQEVGWMFSLLTPAFAAMLVAGPLSRLLLVTNRIELKLIADGACLLLPIGAFLGVSSWGLRAALGALVIATVVAYALYYYLITIAARGVVRAATDTDPLV